MACSGATFGGVTSEAEESERPKRANAQPSYHAGSFACPHCDALTGQHWLGADPYPGELLTNEYGLEWAQCQSESCLRPTLWKGKWTGGQGRARLAENDPVPEMIFPPIAAVGPAPNPDMPEDVKLDFEEARHAGSVTPRGACALARLALQKLCVHLGQDGLNINKDIKALVEAGLPIKIQQSLDVVRVTGNEAVHPGTLDLKDDRDTAQALLSLLNLIVETQISEPRRVQELYDSLPQPKLDGIEARDNGPI